MIGLSLEELDMRPEYPLDTYPNKYEVGDIITDSFFGWTGTVELCTWSHLDCDWYYVVKNGQGKRCPGSWGTFQRDLL